ncbi:Uma2 family endonuclease [Euzebya sp.]|uniref:Uma2 family endonuclease n=1 Tax=Euzebya sp. TaxID=1971409 RepID=UPI0035171A0B
MTTLEIAGELGEAVRGLTRREYDALVETGVLEDEPVELLRGMVVTMAAKGVPHDMAVQWLNMWLARRLPDHLHVRVQSAWAATDDSEPEPDLAIVPARWSPPDGVRSHPQVAELVVEVAGSSLRRDLVVKAPIYAEASVPAYWIVDLGARQVVVHTDPVDGVFAAVSRHRADEVLMACGIEVPLADLFAFTFGEGA